MLYFHFYLWIYNCVDIYHAILWVSYYRKSIVLFADEYNFKSWMMQVTKVLNSNICPDTSFYPKVAWGSKEVQFMATFRPVFRKLLMTCMKIVFSIIYSTINNMTSRNITTDFKYSLRTKWKLSGTMKKITSTEVRTDAVCCCDSD